MRNLQKLLHTFHIPVMGTGFTVDTPLKVAKYGISSVVSIGDDELLEQMREVHSRLHGKDFIAIDENSESKRSRRITAYLNLLNDIVAEQISDMQKSQFDPGSDITRYFELLPESPLKSRYVEMLETSNAEEQAGIQDELKAHIVAGSIDVNVMTKLDRDRYDKNHNKLAPEFADASTALRGFAESDLCSSIVFSAGLNLRLFAYLTTFEDFYPNANNELKKQIILKVSDYRSAIIQGKYLAKRGIWVSEYRIESGLNCGGHAFATEGNLLGPILDVFAQNRSSMRENLHRLYNRALESLGRSPVDSAHDIRITVQGGVGTSEEHNLLFERYGVDSVGWGTPFLLVPEVTNVDEANLAKLVAAKEDDVRLSDHSPLGVPFWSLENSSSEESRLGRIANDRPGSPCPKGFMVSNTEFTDEPICPASRNYQRRKLREYNTAAGSCDGAIEQRDNVICRSCLCVDLAGGATAKYGIDTEASPAVCCGPNIVNFSMVSTLAEMVDHIYGRRSLMANPQRPHMFIKELSLYVEHFHKEFDFTDGEVAGANAKRYQDFKRNLLTGIESYFEFSESFDSKQKESFKVALESFGEEINGTSACLKAA